MTCHFAVPRTVLQEQEYFKNQLWFSYSQFCCFAGTMGSWNIGSWEAPASMSLR